MLSGFQTTTRKKLWDSTASLSIIAKSPLHLIANMDETPLTFDMPLNQTINNTGEKTINIRTTGNEKNHGTVILTCVGDGSKLKAMVIFKRKTLPKVVNKQKVKIAAQEKGLIDTEGMKTWIEKVWGSRRGGLGRRSLLVCDAFEAHVTESIKQHWQEKTPTWQLFLAD